MIRKYYFISKFETNNIDKQDKQTVIIFRNYSSIINKEKLILKIKSYCKTNKYNPKKITIILKVKSIILNKI